MLKRIADPGRFGLAAFVWLVVCQYLVRAEVASAPDPIALLKGAAFVRSQIKPHRLTVEHTVSTVNVSQTHILDLAFSGEERFIRASSPDAQPVYGAAFDGKRAFTYQVQNKIIELRELLLDKNSCLLFDPRILGLRGLPQWEDTVDGVLRHGLSSVTFTNLGREKIGEQSPWHVRLSATNHFRLDFWIGDGPDFRVHATEDNGLRSTSVYSNSVCKALPSYVHCEKRRDSTATEPELSITFRVLREEQIKPSTVGWGLKALGAHKGAMVFDIRKREVVGLWDGQDVRSDTGAVVGEKNSGPLAMAIILAMAATPILIWGMQRLRDRGKNATP